MIIISVGACWRNESIIPSWKLKIIWVSSSLHAVSLSVVTFKLSTLLLSLSAGCVLSFFPLSFLIYSFTMSFPFISSSDFHFFTSFFSVLSLPRDRSFGVQRTSKEWMKKKLKQEGKLWKLFYGHDFCFHCVHIVLQTRLNLEKKKFCEK